MQRMHEVRWGRNLIKAGLSGIGLYWMAEVSVWRRHEHGQEILVDVEWRGMEELYAAMNSFLHLAPPLQNGMGRVSGIYDVELGVWVIQRLLLGLRAGRWVPCQNNHAWSLCQLILYWVDVDTNNTCYLRAIFDAFVCEYVEMSARTALLLVNLLQGEILTECLHTQLIPHIFKKSL